MLGGIELGESADLPDPQRQLDQQAYEGLQLGIMAVNLSLAVHFRPFAVGSIYLSDIGFFLSVTLLTLLLTVRTLGRR